MRTDQSIINRYTVTEGVLSYPVTFPLYERSDVAVYLGRVDGSEHLLVLDADYSVSINDNKTGGTVTLKSGVAQAGSIIAFLSNVPYTQELDLSNVASIDVEATERQMDRTTQQIQQLKEQVERSVLVPPTSIIEPDDLARDLFNARAEAQTWAQYAEAQADRTVQIPSGSEVLAAGSATPRPLSERFADVVNVKDFGAVGDGVTDDTAAIQAAVDFCGKAGGGAIFIPSGKYRTTQQITINSSNIVLFGSSGAVGSTQILVAHAGNGFVFGTLDTNNNRVGLFDIFIVKAGDIGGVAVTITNCHEASVKNVHIYGQFSRGVFLRAAKSQFLYRLVGLNIDHVVDQGILIGDENGMVQDVWISESIIASCGTGIYLANAGGIYMDNIDILDCGVGVQTYPVTGESVTGVWGHAVLADTCTRYGWLLDSGGGQVSEFMLNGCWGSSCGTDVTHCGMRIGSGVEGAVGSIALSGCICINNAGTGIGLSPYVEDVSIVNCQCQFNSQKVTGNKHGIELEGHAKQISIIGGVCGDGVRFEEHRQGYGVFVGAGASDYQIIGVNVLGNISGGILDAGSETKYISKCIGYKTENHGFITLHPDQTTIVVSHGLDVTPAKEEIFLTSLVSLDGADMWVSAADSTTFTITVSKAFPNDKYIGWKCSVKGA